MTLSNAQTGKIYTINQIDTTDQELCSFLFSLGCYRGQAISITSRTKRNLIVALKNSKYSIDLELADIIKV